MPKSHCVSVQGQSWSDKQVIFLEITEAPTVKHLTWPSPKHRMGVLVDWTRPDKLHTALNAVCPHTNVKQKNGRLQRKDAGQTTKLLKPLGSLLRRKHERRQHKLLCRIVLRLLSQLWKWWQGGHLYETFPHIRQEDHPPLNEGQCVISHPVNSHLSILHSFHMMETIKRDNDKDAQSSNRYNTVVVVLHPITWLVFGSWQVIIVCHQSNPICSIKTWLDFHCCNSVQVHYTNSLIINPRQSISFWQQPSLSGTKQCYDFIMYLL